MVGDAVFKLWATLGCDTSEYDESLDESEKKGSNFGKGLKTATKVAAGAIAAVTASTVAGTKAFVDGVSSVAIYGDNIEKTSQKVGLSITKFQEWDYVMNIAGTSMNNMSMGMKTLTNQLDDAKNGSSDALARFEALGLSFEDIQNMSREEVFENVIYGFQGMAESAERAALANDLFGRSGQELTPLFNMTQEETQELIKTANEYGMVMSEDAVKASATFQDSLTTMKNTMAGLKNNMLSEFLPSFSTVMDGLSLVFSGDSKGGLGLIKNGIKNLVSMIGELTPTLVEVGGGIVDALTSAIVENLPTFIESGLNALEKFINGIIDNADMIITAIERIVDIFTKKFLDPTRARKLTQTAINIVVKLANGLIEALPKLIPAIASVIAEIVRTLTQPSNLSMLIQCALQLILALATGLINAIPELIKIIPEVTINVTKALIENFPLVLQTILELIGTLGMAILEALASLMGTSLEEVWSGLSYGFEQLKAWGSNLLSWLSDVANTLLENLVAFLNNPKEYITNALNNIKDFVVNTFNNIKTTVANVFENIKTFIPTAIENIKEAIANGLNAVKQKFTDIFEGLKNAAKSAFDIIKNIFSGEWELPKLKLPHFSIEGKFNFDPTNFSVPKINVDWYKKAYDEPYILNGATIFGRAGGKLLGGGEGSGSEVVVGTNRLMGMIATVVKQVIGDMTFVVPVYVGGRKIDEQIVTANARNSVVSGGR